MKTVEVLQNYTTKSGRIVRPGTYRVPDNLPADVAAYLIEAGYAYDDTPEPVAKKKVSRKRKSPENKSVAKAPENKSTLSE